MQGAQARERRERCCETRLRAWEVVSFSVALAGERERERARTHEVKVVPEVQHQVAEPARSIQQRLDGLDANEHARHLELAQPRADRRGDVLHEPERHDGPLAAAGRARARVVQREGRKGARVVEERLEGGEEGGEGRVPGSRVCELERLEGGEVRCGGGKEGRRVEGARFKGEMAQVRESREEGDEGCAGELGAAGESERREVAAGERGCEGGDDPVVDDGRLAAQDAELLEKEDVVVVGGAGTRG